MIPGTYRHYKGGRYRLMYEVQAIPRFLDADFRDVRHENMILMGRDTESLLHSETGESCQLVLMKDSGVTCVLTDTTVPGEMMMYYVSLDHSSHWVRPNHMFNELVYWPDGVKRARFIREDFDA